jgi:putative flippase GtrA
MIVRLLDRLRRDDGRAQFVRFVAVGAIANLLYGALFVLLADLGSQAANVAGSIASSALANELHRRLTFHAGARVSWQRAQWEGGGLALAGMVATTAALGWFDALAPGSGAVAQLVVVAVVTGAVGLIRFVVLRWVRATGRRSRRPAWRPPSSARPTLPARPAANGPRPLHGARRHVLPAGGTQRADA